MAWLGIDTTGGLKSRDELIAESKRRLERGDAIEDVIGFLRSSGCWKTDSIAIIRAACNVGLAKAKELVHVSNVWKDTRASDEQFHEELFEAALKSKDIEQS